MPIHDWSSAPHGLFLHFHQFWSMSICRALNDGRMPKGYYALIEQSAIGLVPDVLALERQPSRSRERGPSPDRGGVAVADVPPKARYIKHAETSMYTAKANRVVVHRSGNEVVGVIEIVSPGNKDGQHRLRQFLAKTAELLSSGVNLLVIDLFPPSSRDPQGIHPLIWSDVRDEPFELPADKPLTLAGYDAHPPETAYVEPVGVGDKLPDMPIFIDEGLYVPVPLEATYEEAWQWCPREFHEDVTGTSDG